MRNEQIGFIFQFPSLLPSLTVLENVLLPTAFGRADAGRTARARATELIASVGLTDKLGALPRRLSKGQQQRVVVARSLINGPRLLIADEPTSDLDEQTEREIMDLLRRVHESTGVSILLVTHATELTRYGTRAVRMVGGAVVD
jgi:ABC-type lipoprotein export system ATPase subunit